MWDEQDTFARWVQFLCAIPLLAFGAFVEYYVWTSFSRGSYVTRYGFGSLGLGSFYLGFRCLWYAVTGQDNINRDEANTLRNFFGSDDF